MFYYAMFTVYAFVGFLTFTFILLQVILSITVSLKCRKISMEMGIPGWYDLILQKITFTFLICPIIYAVIVGVAMWIPYRNVQGFIFGTVVAIMFSLKPILNPSQSVQEYIDSNIQYYNADKEVVSYLITHDIYARKAYKSMVRHMSPNQREEFEQLSGPRVMPTYDEVMNSAALYDIKFENRYGQFVHPYTGKPISSAQDYLDAVMSQEQERSIVTERYLTVSELNEMFRQRYASKPEMGISNMDDFLEKVTPSSHLIDTPVHEPSPDPTPSTPNRTVSKVPVYVLGALSTVLAIALIMGFAYYSEEVSELKANIKDINKSISENEQMIDYIEDLNSLAFNHDFHANMHVIVVDKNHTENGYIIFGYSGTVWMESDNENIEMEWISTDEERMWFSVTGVTRGMSTIKFKNDVNNLAERVLVIVR